MVTGEELDNEDSRIVLEIHAEPFDRSSPSRPWGRLIAGAESVAFDGWVDLAGVIEQELLRRDRWTQRPSRSEVTK